MIRNAKLEDLPAIIAIYNASIPDRQSTADTEPISVESRLTWFEEHQGQRPLWVFEYQHAIAGWLSLQNFYSRPAYQATAEVSIYIKPEYKRLGIAKTLLSHAIQESGQLNISTLLGVIFGHNEPSINLFKSFGFNQWGFLPRIANLDGFEKNVMIYGLRLDEETGKSALQMGQ